jgi:protein-tyrosine phosphatase
MDNFPLMTAINSRFGTYRGLIRLALAQAEFALGRISPFCDKNLPGLRRVVFVCLGNINRSCFAERVSRRLGIEACSLGLSTLGGQPANGKAIEFAPKFQVDLNNHVTTEIADYQYREGDYLFVMEIRHAKRLTGLGFPAANIRLLGRWAQPMRIHIHDPHTLSDGYFQTCFTVIRSAVENLAGQLRDVNSLALREDN